MFYTLNQSRLIGLLQTSLILSISIAFTGVGPAAAQSTLLVEAESFQFPGQWLMRTDARTLSNKMMQANPRERGGTDDAITVIELAESGDYDLWVRARDYLLDRPGTRTFHLLIDNEQAPEPAGDHGYEAWRWEKVGQRKLEAGRHVLALRDTSNFYGRVDAVLLTAESLDPNDWEEADFDSIRVEPVQIELEQDENLSKLPLHFKAEGLDEPIAVISNDAIQMRFFVVPDDSQPADGAARVVRQTLVKMGDDWVAVSKQAGVDRLLMLRSEEAGYSPGKYFPEWESRFNQLSFEVRGQQYDVLAEPTNPYLAGEPTLYELTDVRPVDGRTASLIYRERGGDEIQVRVELPAGNKPEAQYETDLSSTSAAYLSLADLRHEGFEPDDVKAVQLPPVYQFHRLPSQPKLATSSLTPHPVAMVEIAAGHDGTSAITIAAVAETRDLPFVWPDEANARYGLALMDPAQRISPVVMAPVLGTTDSARRRDIRWRRLAYPGKWTEAMAYFSSEVAGVRDYRRPIGASLSDAANNMIELMRDPWASGWDDELKGFWNIEIESTVTQSSPLSVLAASLLARDEQLYIERGLPSLAFLLTRPTAHHTDRPPNRALHSEEAVALRVPNPYYDSRVFQGAHDLLSRANPWLAELALQPDGSLRRPLYANSTPKFASRLGQYALDKDPKTLGRIRQEADRFVKRWVQDPVEQFPVFDQFYHWQYYPSWWDLLEVYELTSASPYLDAAEQLAFQTIAGMWSHPMPPDGLVTIHPDGVFLGDEAILLKGDKPFRLNNMNPPAKLPARDVPAWQVSPVGLSFEQTITYFRTSGGHRIIMASNWAAPLLRLYGHTGRELFRTYARNSIIGRFANYPGYYLAGFTDVHQQPDYPYVGPDVTSIYYHHIPVQLGLTLDFLTAQLETRSKGAIAFPWVNQQNYVWFDDRIPTTAPGQVFDDHTAQLTFGKDRVEVDAIDVSCLTARGAETHYAFLINDTAKPVRVHPNVDQEAAGLTGVSPTVLDASGQSRPEWIGDDLSVLVPGGELVVLSYPAKSRPSFGQVPPLAAGHVSQKVEAPWSEVHAFRVRSPFGWDSLYLACTGKPIKGATLRVSFPDQDIEPLTDSSFPLEVTLNHWPMDKPIRVHVELQQPGDDAPQSIDLALPGT